MVGFAQQQVSIANVMALLFNADNGIGLGNNCVQFLIGRVGVCNGILVNTQYLIVSVDIAAFINLLFLPQQLVSVKQDIIMRGEILQAAVQFAFFLK